MAAHNPARYKILTEASVMGDFLNFGNKILRRDAIESIVPEIVGKHMRVIITMKSGCFHATTYSFSPLGGSPESTFNDE
jgi:hypothetical protein